MQITSDTEKLEVGQEASPTQISSEQPIKRLYDRRATFFTILGVMLISFIAVLDQTVIGTAIPHIAADLHGFSQITWVTTIYLLTSTVTIPIYGKLSDMFGRKPLFLFGIIVFLGGSALCGLAQTMTQLVIFRAIQGIGSGGLQPIAAIIIADLFPARERGKWQGVFGGTYALAAIIGPLVGGFLTDNFSWHWVFYINLPIGLVTLLTLIFLMPNIRLKKQRVTLDYIGSGLLILGTLPLLLGLSWAGSQYPWLSTQIIGLLGSALVILSVLTIYSARQERRGKEPVIEPSLFTAQPRIFTVSLLATMAAAVALMGSSYFIPLFVQAITGASATNSGLTMMPMMLAAIVGSSFAGIFVSRTGRYKWISLSGVVVSIAGVFLLTRLTAQSGIGDIMLGMAVLGGGLGVSMSVYTVIVQNAMPNKIAAVTAMLTYFRQIGQSIGLAAMGSVVNASYGASYPSRLPPDLSHALPPQIIQVFTNPLALLSPDTMAHLRAVIKKSGPHGQMAFASLLTSIKVSLTASIHNVFLLSLIMMVAMLIVVCFLKEIPLQGRADL